MPGSRPNAAAPHATLLRAPAVQALSIQFAAFAAVLALAMLTEWQPTVASAALFQGAVAAMLSRWRGLALWWLAIQFAFPVASLLLLSLHLPSWLFLAVFMFLLGLYWSTFRTQVPFYPSDRATWETVAGLLPQERAVRFIDIGSGLGGLPLHLADARPESSFAGIEIAPLPWLASVLRARIRGSSARFIRGDYDRLDFGDYDVVFAYLSPAAMPALWSKALAEMRPGSLLLSHEFPIPGVAPDFTLAPLECGPLLHGWRMQESQRMA